MKTFKVKIKKWFKFPQNIYPHYATWYNILRRIIIFPIIFVGIILVFTGFILGYDFKKAKDFWNEMF